VLNQLAIVIATYNNRSGLQTALKSISLNSKHPNTVSIVSSGDLITDIIMQYKTTLNILHEHVDRPGQYSQRQKALHKVFRNHDLVLFLDDYAILNSQFIKECCTSFSQVNEKVVGMGVTITNHKIIPPKFIVLRKMLQNYSTNEGKVLKSGIGIPYQNLNKFSSTQWLNGASVWKSFIFLEFYHAEMSGSYSAAEDLIFSYPIGKKYQLVTNSDLQIEISGRQIQSKRFLNRTLSSNLNRLYFVEQHKELSKFWFYVNFFLSFTLVFFKFLVSFNPKMFYILLGNILSLPYLTFYEILHFFGLIPSKWLTNRL
jgi:hypothetical protein